MAVDYSKFLNGDSLRAIKAYVDSTFLGKTSQAVDSAKLNGQAASYYLNYNNLTNKPTIPTVNNGTLTIQKNGTTVATFTANQSGNITANITVPTSFSGLSSRGEAWLEWGGKNFSGSYGPIDAAMVPELGANRLAFLKVSNGTAIGASVEYSRDGGSTWTDYGATADQISNLFNGNGNGFTIGKATSGEGNIATNQYQLRVNIFTSIASIYTVLNKFVIYLSTSGTSQNWCTIRARLQSNVESSTDTWTVFANKVSVSGWSGYNVINTSGLTTYGNTKSSQYGQIQFIFGCDVGSTDTRYAGLNISKIFGFGGVGWTTPSTMAKTGHMYTYDANQNVIFPAQVRAVTLNENGTTLANKYLGKTAQAADSAKLNGQAASYYLNYNNLTNKPTIPTVSDATITIKQTGISDQTFTLNGSAVTITLVDTNTWRPLGTGATDACAGNDSRLSDARTPTSHTHGNITNTGTITSTAVTSATGVLVYDSSNKIQRATAANARSIIGAGTYSKPSGGIPSTDLAESYYLASNPNGYTSNTGTITGVSVNGTSVATSGVANITSVPWSIISDHGLVRELVSFADANAGNGIIISGGNSGYGSGGTYLRHTSTSSSYNTLKLPSSDGTLALTSQIPSAYLKSASVSGNTLTLTKQDNTTLTFTPSFTDTNYYPIRSYTSGLQISSYSGSSNCQLYVPYASATQAGVISTGDQTLNGNKTFSNGDVIITEGALKINSDDSGTWSGEDWDTWFYSDRIKVLNADTEETWSLLFPQLSADSEATLATLETNQTFTGINTFQGGAGGGGQYGSDLGYIQFRGVSSLSTAFVNLRALGSSGTTYNILLPAKNGTLATTDQIPAAAPNWWYYESSFTRTLNSGSSVQGPSLMKINSTSGGNEYAVVTSGSTISTVNIKIGDLIFTKYGEIGCVTSIPSIGSTAPGYVGYRVKWISGASWYCLEEGSLITMFDGSRRPIEEVKQGDSILGWDFENNKPCEAIVLFANFTHRDDKTNFVVFSNGEYISGTEDHFIYSVDKGRDAPISELQEGEKCLDANGEIIEIYGIHRGIYQMGQKNFYHLVSSNNTYFANGVMNAAHPINKFNWMAYGANQNIPQEIMDILIKDAEEFRTYEFLVKNETFRKQSVNLMKEIKTRQNKITELKQFLEDTDYVTIKHSEGLPIDPKILEERQNARDIINQLTEEIDSNYQPAYNSLVIEYSPLGADTLLTNEERRAKYFKVANKRDNEALDIFKKYYQKDNKNDK